MIRVPTARPAAVGALLLLLASGCDLPGGVPSAAGATGTPKPDSTDSWVVVAEGSRSPSPAPGRFSPTPSATPARPTPAAVEPTATAAPTCAGVSRPGQLDGLTVVPGSGSATVSWYHVGDPALVRYRVAAVPQRLAAGSQPAPDWREVPPGAPCRTVTTTLDGLTSGAPYVFWLDAVSTAQVGGGTRDMSVGRSGVVVVG